jgi:hypothetical protein
VGDDVAGVAATVDDLFQECNRPLISLAWSSKNVTES